MADTEAIVSQGLQTGGAPNISDAYTINGLPGPLHNCSAEGTVLRGNAKIVLLTETLRYELKVLLLYHEDYLHILAAD
jgi:hypothetical protein